jgi:hypothetical protein
MPQLSQIIEDRLQVLIKSKPSWPGAGASDAVILQAMRPQTYAWCISAATLIEAVVPLGHPYKMAVISQTAQLNAGGSVDGPSAALFALLLQLKADFEAGLLSNLQAQVAAQTFDDLLDHAEEYLRQRRKEPAGILTGVVFEDTIRKLCRRHHIPEAGVNLDTLLSDLVKKAVLLPIDRADCTTAGSLRTSATHARWEKFGEENVKSVLAFTRRLIREKLAV